MIVQQRMQSSDNSQAGTRELRVVAIGGGTGLSTLLKGLKGYVSTPALSASGKISIRELSTDRLEVQELIVDIHNHFRSRVKPAARNMLEMVYAMPYLPHNEEPSCYN